MRLLYAIFVSSFTQNKLKKNEDVVLPINESAVMKAKLTEWISQAVQEMQQSKQREEKILQCYEKTGVLDVWSSKRHELYLEAVEKRRELFPNMVDDSGVINDIDDLEEVTGLATRVDTAVNKETGEVRTFEEEEDADIEQQLVERLAQHAASLETVDAEEEQDAGDMQLVCHSHAGF